MAGYICAAGMGNCNGRACWRPHGASVLRISAPLKTSLAIAGLLGLLSLRPDYARCAPQSSQPVTITAPKAGDVLEAAARRKRAKAPARTEVEELPPQPAPEDMPPLPERAPPEIREKPAAAREPLGPEAPPPEWSAGEIREAAFECGRLFTENRFEFKNLPPIRSGVCGTPAPVSLKYINHVPRVELRPAVTMNCQIGDALERWLRDVVQPRAKQLLDANVIRVGNLAAYDCRARYGSPNERISQHAFANAIDIAEFVTAKGEHIRVVEHWDSKDERAQFLKDIHKGACEIFGTVLGPEANEAHKNHFHLDLTPRRHRSVCE